MESHFAEILNIIEAGINGNATKVFSYAELLSTNLEKEKDTETALMIRSILKKNKTLTLHGRQVMQETVRVPIDPESRLPLAEVHQYHEQEVLLVPTINVKEDVDEFIELIKNGERLTDKSILIYRNLLLYGPPGTGKTQTAKYISSKTGLPLVTVRIDSLLSSYLGNTSKNIRTLFDFIEKNKCILFLDEFDAIAKMRDDSNELGELKRVVNSLLQNLDSLQGKVPVIAATNHQHLLDSAVWRRFDYKLFVDYPNIDQRRTLIEKFLPLYFDKGDNGDVLSILTDGMSGAEIKSLADMIKTRAALENLSEIDEKAIFDLYVRYYNKIVHPQKSINMASTVDYRLNIIKDLRTKNRDMITYRLAAKLLGVALSTAHNLLSEESNA